VTSPALLKKYPMPPSLGDIEGMIERKAALGIDLTLIGTPVGAGTMMRIPGHDNYAQSADELKAHHDWLASTVAAHPGRLLAYAYVNPFGEPALMDEAARLVREDGFVGLMVNTSVQGRFLDDDRAKDFWALAAELGTPVMLHPPAEPVGSEALDDMRLVEQVGRFFDVSVAVAAIIFSGVLEEYPSLRLVASAGGGGLSLVMNRLDTAYAPKHWGGPPPGAGPGGPPAGAGPGGPPPWARVENKISRPPSSFLRQIWVDTANPNPQHHAANLAAFGADRILFGTDAPPLSSPLEDALAAVDNLPLDDAGKQAILGGNAQALFAL
jgi:aminocarboxymuconate-semialdehyde decarboxylase